MNTEHNHSNKHDEADSHPASHTENHEYHAHHADHAVHAGHAHGSHDHSDHVEQYRKLFWLNLLLAIPVVAFNPMFAHLIGYTLPDSGWAKLISPILGTVIYILGGRPFLTGAVDEIKNRKPGMMLLIGLAITVAFLASAGSALGILPPELNYWWELALLVVIMLLGHWVEMRSLARTSSALDELAALLPDEAELAEGDEIRTVHPSELQIGDIVIVRPGGTIPADGEITEGAAGIDESMITGESKTVHRSRGDAVVAGTVATDSGIRIRITKTGDDTALAGIRKLVEDAQSSSSRAQRIADRAAAWLFWYALGAAVLTAVIWTAIGQPDRALVRAITVLIIACPHALGLAIPLVVSIATERAAAAGILVKDRLALESMRQVDTVLFDKTGTLTRGEPEVTALHTENGVQEDELLGLAAAAEGDSEHPLAYAIRTAAKEKNITVPKAGDFSSSPAVGVRAEVNGDTIQVGGPYLLEQEQAASVAPEAWDGEGAIVLHVLKNGTPLGALRIEDAVREESKEAVQALQERNVEVVMITGDAKSVAERVGRELGIRRIYAGVRPEDKAKKVEELKAEGRRVAMVGDGVNDAPALAAADVGIAIGAGTDVAIGSAGVILASDNPKGVLSVYKLSEAAYRKMKQNLWWAAGYNILAVPLAAGVLSPVGFILPMSVGALLMSASTVIVAANAQLLRKLDLRS